MIFSFYKSFVFKNKIIEKEVFTCNRSLYFTRFNGVHQLFVTGYRRSRRYILGADFRNHFLFFIWKKKIWLDRRYLFFFRRNFSWSWFYSNIYPRLDHQEVGNKNAFKNGKEQLNCFFRLNSKERNNCNYYFIINKFLSQLSL